jgi:hypothetical protein
MNNNLNRTTSQGSLPSVWRFLTGSQSCVEAWQLPCAVVRATKVKKKKNEKIQLN